MLSPVTSVTILSWLRSAATGLIRDRNLKRCQDLGFICAGLHAFLIDLVVNVVVTYIRMIDVVELEVHATEPQPPSRLCTDI